MLKLFPLIYHISKGKNEPRSQAYQTSAVFNIITSVDKNLVEQVDVYHNSFCSIYRWVCGIIRLRLLWKTQDSGGIHFKLIEKQPVLLVSFAQNWRRPRKRFAHRWVALSNLDRNHLLWSRCSGGYFKKSVPPTRARRFLVYEHRQFPMTLLIGATLENLK